MDLFKSNESKVEELVEKALGASQTYGDALVYIDATPWTVEGSLLRDAVREEIKKKALDSQIRLTGIQEAKSEEATEKESVLGKIFVKVETSNLEEVAKMCGELAETLEKVKCMVYEYEVLAVDVNEALKIIEKIKSSHQLGDDVKIKTTISPF